MLQVIDLIVFSAYPSMYFSGSSKQMIKETYKKGSCCDEECNASLVSVVDNLKFGFEDLDHCKEENQCCYVLYNGLPKNTIHRRDLCNTTDAWAPIADWYGWRHPGLNYGASVIMNKKRLNNHCNGVRHDWERIAGNVIGSQMHKLYWYDYLLPSMPIDAYTRELPIEKYWEYEGSLHCESASKDFDPIYSKKYNLTHSQYYINEVYLFTQYPDCSTFKNALMRYNEHEANNTIYDQGDLAECFVQFYTTIARIYNVGSTALWNWTHAYGVDAFKIDEKYNPSQECNIAIILPNGTHYEYKAASLFMHLNLDMIELASSINLFGLGGWFVHAFYSGVSQRPDDYNWGIYFPHLSKVGGYLCDPTCPTYDGDLRCLHPPPENCIPLNDNPNICINQYG